MSERGASGETSEALARSGWCQDLTLDDGDKVPEAVEQQQRGPTN